MAPNVNTAATTTEDQTEFIKKRKFDGKTPQQKQKIIEDENNNETIDTEIDYSTMLPAEIGTDYNYKRRIVWFNVIGFAILHLAALYGLYLGMTQAHPLTIVFSAIMLFMASEGVTIGAHRMYSHKALKGHFITRLGLIVLQTMAGQNCMYIWVRDHRQHHKFSDTDADPHNSNRGFFFSHIGWLMARKHPAVIAKGRAIDMSDLENDAIVMWQKVFYKPLYVIFAIGFPVAIPIWLWDESYLNSFFVSYMARYILQLNGTWLVNSWAHMFGYKPYDKNINSVETRFVDTLSFGEGWHNYHHAFPWDYRAAELGIRYSPTTFVIDCLAKLGLVYDLKTASSNLIKHKIKNSGDGTHPTNQPKEDNELDPLYKKLTKYAVDNQSIDDDDDDEEVDGADVDLKGRKSEVTQRVEVPVTEWDQECHELAKRGY